MRAVRGAFFGLVVAVLIAAGCGNGSGTVTTTATNPIGTSPATHKPEKLVVVHESEYKLDPANTTGGIAGPIKIKIYNDGKIAHSLAVDGPNGPVILAGDVQPGQSRILGVDLDQRGTYKWYCPIDGHRAKGMSGTITGGGSTPARGAEPTGTTTTTPQTTPTQTQTQTQTQTETKTVTTPSNPSTTPTATTGTGSSGYGY